MLKTFLAGAVVYPVLELLWRGRSHWTMAMAGGASTALISRIRTLPLRRSTQALLCGVGITGIEYLIGRTANRDYQIWDYRNTPLNLHGQICLPYSLVWYALSAGVLSFMDAAEKMDG